MGVVTGGKSVLTNFVGMSFTCFVCMLIVHQREVLVMSEQGWNSVLLFEAERGVARD